MTDDIQAEAERLAKRWTLRLIFGYAAPRAEKHKWLEKEPWKREWEEIADEIAAALGRQRETGRIAGMLETIAARLHVAIHKARGGCTPQQLNQGPCCPPELCPECVREAALLREAGVTDEDILRPAEAGTCGHYPEMTSDDLLETAWGTHEPGDRVRAYFRRKQHFRVGAEQELRDALEIALAALGRCNQEHAEVIAGFRGHTHAQLAIDRMADALAGKEGAP